MLQRFLKVFKSPLRLFLLCVFGIALFGLISLRRPDESHSKEANQNIRFYKIESYYCNLALFCKSRPVFAKVFETSWCDDCEAKAACLDNVLALNKMLDLDEWKTPVHVSTDGSSTVTSFGPDRIPSPDDIHHTINCEK